MGTIELEQQKLLKNETEKNLDAIINRGAYKATDAYLLSAKNHKKRNFLSSLISVRGNVYGMTQRKVNNKGKYVK